MKTTTVKKTASITQKGMIDMSKRTVTHAAQNNAPKRKPLPSCIKALPKPRVLPNGLLITRASIRKTIQGMDKALAHSIVAVGKEYEDARTVKGNWFTKPTRNLPAIVFEASEDLAEKIQNSSSLQSLDNITSMAITWDKDNPKLMLAYGLFVSAKLPQYLGKYQSHTIGDDNDEVERWVNEFVDVKVYVDDYHHENGFYGNSADDANSLGQRFWRHPLFHSEEIKEVEDYIAEHQDD